MNKSQEQSKLTMRFWGGTFLIFVTPIVGIIIFSNLIFNIRVQAFTTKSPGIMLQAQDWNDLAVDFVPVPASCNDDDFLQWSSGIWICASGGGGFGPPNFDSGWRPIATPGLVTLVFDTVQPGNTLTASNQDFLVEFSGSEFSNGSNPHISAFGSQMCIQNGQNGPKAEGAHWLDLTDNDITVRRQGQDQASPIGIAEIRPWNFFRIRIWDTTP